MARHGGAALEAPAEKTFGILDAARPKIRAQQRLLEDVALGSAAAHALRATAPEEAFPPPLAKRAMVDAP